MTAALGRGPICPTGTGSHGGCRLMAARAGSTDVRCGHRARRSLGEILRFALLASLGFLRRLLRHGPPWASQIGDV